jgi:hypothetical protein
VQRGRQAEADPRLWAAADDGVITARALVELGVPETTTYRRCRDGGPWQRLASGIILLHNGPPTRRQREIAALLHGGDTAMLTGASALRHHGMRRAPDSDTVHVLIRHDRQVRSEGLIRVERTRRLPLPQERDGLAVAPLIRAVLDEVRTMRDATEIAAIIAEPVQRGRVLQEALLEELDAGCRRGSATPRAVLRAVIDGIRSAAEFEAREWWLAQPELPAARFNARVLDLDGRLVAIVDVLVEDVGFVWEIDSVEEHFARPDQVEATLERRRELHDVGLYVLSTRPGQRRDDPAGTLRDIRHGLAVAARLPSPSVRYEDDETRSA